MTRRDLSVAVALCASLSLGACGVMSRAQGPATVTVTVTRGAGNRGGGGGTAGSTGTPSPTDDATSPTQSSTQTPTAGSPSSFIDGGGAEPPPKVCPNNSSRGCLTHDQMMPYIYRVVPMVQTFISAERQARRDVANLRLVGTGETGYEECQDGRGQPIPYDRWSYGYCPADRSIYLGQDQLWVLYTDTGPLAPAIAIAHAYGHHLQSTVGVPEPTTAADATRHENQADCIAGAWTEWAAENNLLDMNAMGKPDALMQAIASAEDDPDRHGDLSERVDAFAWGANGGLSACNSFYADTPLLRR